MDAAVAGDLRVERAAEQCSLPDKNNFAVVPGQHVYAWPGLHHIRRPDKNRAERLRPQRGNVQGRFKRVHLPPEGIAGHDHI